MKFDIKSLKDVVNDVKNQLLYIYYRRELLNPKKRNELIN